MSRVMKFLFILVGFSLAMALWLIPSAQKIKETEKKVQVFVGKQVIVADIAETEKEKRGGLSGRKYMKTNEGMLFLFEEKGYHSLWMKGMKIPIDVIWISGREIVGFEEHILPEFEKKSTEFTVYEPPAPVDKFLELRGGRIGLFNVEVGDTIEIKRIIPSGSDNF